MGVCGFGDDHLTFEMASLENVAAHIITPSHGPLHYSAFEAQPEQARASDDLMRVVDAAVSGQTLILPFSFEIEMKNVDDRLLSNSSESILLARIEGVRQGFLQAYGEHLPLQKNSSHTFLVQAGNVQVEEMDMGQQQQMQQQQQQMQQQMQQQQQQQQQQQNYQFARNISLHVKAQLIVIGNADLPNTRLINGSGAWLTAAQNSTLRLAIEMGLPHWAFNSNAPLQNLQINMGAIFYGQYPPSLSHLEFTAVPNLLQRSSFLPPPGIVPEWTVNGSKYVVTPHGVNAQQFEAPREPTSCIVNSFSPYSAGTLYEGDGITIINPAPNNNCSVFVRYPRVALHSWPPTFQWTRINENPEHQEICITDSAHDVVCGAYVATLLDLKSPNHPATLVKVIQGQHGETVAHGMWSFNSTWTEHLDDITMRIDLPPGPPLVFFLPRNVPVTDSNIDISLYPSAPASARDMPSRDAFPVLDFSCVGLDLVGSNERALISVVSTGGMDKTLGAMRANVQTNSPYPNPNSDSYFTHGLSCFTFVLVPASRQTV